MTRLLPLLLILTTLDAPSWAPAWPPSSQRPAASSSLPAADSTIVVYLVRHAEKLDDSRDPPLNEEGKRRADLLADMLQDAGITGIWSTEYQRTLATARPLASRLGLEVRAYQAGELAAFAAILLRTPGRHLVVGHSNTTPDLVRALGGEPHDAFKDSEYDRLYTIVASGGQVTTVLLRFGDRPAL